MTIRSPICTVLGHVDHGKSSILDKIRNTSITATEAGGITQAIGASIIPITTIKKITGDLLKAQKLTIPGLLFIDTPGHAAFSNLRKRGGNLADIAIVVIDISEGFMPQTIESIEILKKYKTPFVIAANKIDRIQGWKTKDNNLLKNINSQDPATQQKFETKIYEIVGKLYEIANLESERYDRITDFTKQISIIPTSAITGEGIPELLMMITGLAQKYLEKNLNIEVKGPAKGTILEVKEVKGIGHVIDAIIYEGSLKVNDTLVIGSLDIPLVTKVKGLFQPPQSKEMRDKKSIFTSTKEVSASIGVRISANDIENALGGMPLQVANTNLNEVLKQIKHDVDEVVIETDTEGIIIKADTLGSLEAMQVLLKEKNIKIRKASLGNISKKDILDAESSYEKDPKNSIILGFNITTLPDIQLSDKVKIILDNVIYKLMDNIHEWHLEIEKRKQEAELSTLTRPAKIKLLTGYVFRQSNPAVVGTEILAGELRTNSELMKQDGTKITVVKEIQSEKKNVSKAESGKQVAVSYDKVIIGRQINEGEILYTAIDEKDFRKMKEMKKHLTNEEKEVLKEIAEIMRKNNSIWGM